MRGRDDSEMTHEDRYWDDIVLGRTSPLGVDPTVAEAIAAIHGADDTTGPNADFVRRLGNDLRYAAPPLDSSRERVRRDLRAPDRPIHLDEELTVNTADISWPMGTNGLAPAGPIPFPRAAGSPRPLRGRISALTAAAMLLAILGSIVAAAIVANRGPNDDDRDVNPILVALASPSPAAESSPAAAPEDEVVLDIILPAEALGISDDWSAGTSFDLIPPGIRSEYEWYSRDFGVGPMVRYVVSGSFVASVDGPTQLVRVGGETEDIAPNTEVTVAMGEALVSRNEYAVVTTNPAVVEAEVVTWLLYEDPFASFSGRGGSGEQDIVTQDLDATSDVPEITASVSLRIRRVLLAPGDWVDTTNSFSLIQGVTRDIEVDITKRFNDEGIFAVDSEGNLTLLYVTEMIPRSA